MNFQRTFEELFQGVFALDWENYLPLGAKFPISKAKCVKSKLHNEPSVQAISKKLSEEIAEVFPPSRRSASPRNRSGI
ncbi:MAG: THUMP domain-containing protein [Streptococcus salivarius]